MKRFRLRTLMLLILLAALCLTAVGRPTIRTAQDRWITGAWLQWPTGEIVGAYRRKGGEYGLCFWRNRQSAYTTGPELAVGYYSERGWLSVQRNRKVVWENKKWKSGR